MNNAFRKFLLTLSLAMLIPLTHAKEPAETHEIRSDVMEYIMTNYKAATPAQRGRKMCCLNDAVSACRTLRRHNALVSHFSHRQPLCMAQEPAFAPLLCKLPV